MQKGFLSAATITVFIGRRPGRVILNLKVQILRHPMQGIVIT
jgi:hypothetical protein